MTLNQGFIFAASRASQAAADAAHAADVNDARRNLDGALHRHRVVAERIARQHRTRAAQKADMAAMLRAVRANA